VSCPHLFQVDTGHLGDAPVPQSLHVRQPEDQPVTVVQLLPDAGKPIEQHPIARRANLGKRLDRYPLSAPHRLVVQPTVRRQWVATLAPLSLQESRHQGSQHEVPKVSAALPVRVLVEGADRRLLDQLLGPALVEREAEGGRVQIVQMTSNHLFECPRHVA
jgi:hypothetical protein